MVNVQRRNINDKSKSENGSSRHFNRSHFDYLNYVPVSFERVAAISSMLLIRLLVIVYFLMST
jgi:hypothetical protein